MDLASPRFEISIRQASVLALPVMCEVLSGERSICNASDSLRSLRIRTGQQDDVTTDPQWFAGMTTSSGRIPWVVKLFQGDELVAAMLFSERCILGIPSGYLKADGAFGEEFLICPANLRTAYMPALLQGLFARRSVLIAHVAQAADAETAFAHLPEDAPLDLEWKRRPSHYRLPLGGSMEETLAPYGVRTRRNLRYYLRKCRSEGCHFITKLTNDERMEAVMSLAHDATHRLPIASVLRREATMQAMPNSFALGMRAADGSWLSYITGWKQARQTFVYSQMNRIAGSNSSVSTAIRAYLMEQEIACGTREIVFIGGTSPVFMRCCEEDLCVDLIVRRRGWRTTALSLLLNWLLPPGHPLRAR